MTKEPVVERQPRWQAIELVVVDGSYLRDLDPIAHFLASSRRPFFVPSKPVIGASNFSPINSRGS